MATRKVSSKSSTSKTKKSSSGASQTLSKTITSGEYNISDEVGFRRAVIECIEDSSKKPSLTAK